MMMPQISALPFIKEKWPGTLKKKKNINMEPSDAVLAP